MFLRCSNPLGIPSSFDLNDDGNDGNVREKKTDEGTTVHPTQKPTDLQMIVARTPSRGS